jgi:hypothetical protein
MSPVAWVVQAASRPHRERRRCLYTEGRKRFVSGLPSRALWIRWGTPLPMAPCARSVHWTNVGSAIVPRRMIVTSTALVHGVAWLVWISVVSAMETTPCARTALGKFSARGALTIAASAMPRGPMTVRQTVSASGVAV